MTVVRRKRGPPSEALSQRLGGMSKRGSQIPRGGADLRLHVSLFDRAMGKLGHDASLRKLVRYLREADNPTDQTSLVRATCYDLGRSGQRLAPPSDSHQDLFAHPPEVLAAVLGRQLTEAIGTSEHPFSNLTVGLYIARAANDADVTRVVMDSALSFLRNQNFRTTPEHSPASQHQLAALVRTMFELDPEHTSREIIEILRNVNRNNELGGIIRGSLRELGQNVLLCEAIQTACEGKISKPNTESSDELNRTLETIFDALTSQEPEGKHQELALGLLEFARCRVQALDVSPSKFTADEASLELVKAYRAMGMPHAAWELVLNRLPQFGSMEPPRLAVLEAIEDLSRTNSLNDVANQTRSLVVQTLITWRNTAPGLSNAHRYYGAGPVFERLINLWRPDEAVMEPSGARRGKGRPP